MSVLIKNGRVITAVDDYFADIFIKNETVTLIGEKLDIEADEVIDASGKYLIPGGLDPHTHLDMPFGAPRLQTILKLEHVLQPMVEQQHLLILLFNPKGIQHWKH